MSIPIRMVVGAGLLLSGCGIRQALPTGPVLSPEQIRAFDVSGPARVTYTGDPRVAFPVIPLQVFGVHYGLDLVLVSDHPEWSMHEYARLDLPEGPLWLAKDTDEAGHQAIVADLPEIEALLPEVPLERSGGALEVIDGSDEDRVDVRIAYVNTHGDPVAVHFQSEAPGPVRRRNGSTFDHSAELVAAVLDLSRSAQGHLARIEIDGERRRIQRLGGLYRMQIALEQSQGGVAVTRFRQEESGEGFQLHRPGEGEWPTLAVEDWQVSPGLESVASRDGRVTRLVYTFAEGELQSAEVFQVLRAEAVFALHLDPALPDLRRPFAGVAVARFRMDINGQAGFGSGEIRVAWQDADRVVLEVLPDAPWWLAARPMRGTVFYDENGSVKVEMERIARGSELLLEEE